MRRLLLLPLLTLPALAQSALSPLKDHPLLKQAEAYLLAARKSLEAQAAPLALNVQGNYLRYGYTCEPEAVCASLPEAAQSLTLALVLTPFPFGEVADGVERAQIALRRAELAYRKTRAGLEAQAVAAYGRYQEARLGVRIAEKGLELAQKALEAARKRQANPKELREAELALEEAQNRLEEARRGLALALEAARDLVDPEAPLPPIPEPKGTTPLSLEEARLNLLEAQIALEAAQRNLLPTLQGSYTRYPSGNDTLSLSLSSKTLQPTLAYTRQNPAQAATALPGGGRYRATEELRLSLSLTLSPGLFAALAHDADRPPTVLPSSPPPARPACRRKASRRAFWAPGPPWPWRKAARPPRRRPWRRQKSASPWGWKAPSGSCRPSSTCSRRSSASSRRKTTSGTGLWSFTSFTESFWR